MRTSVPVRMRRSMAALGVVTAAWASWASPARAAPTLFLDYEIVQGAVDAADADCTNPFAGCVFAVGARSTGRLSGEINRSSEWSFVADLTLSFDDSLPTGQWRAAGTFNYADVGADLPPQVAEQFFGSYTGVFDEATFTATLDFTVDFGLGRFQDRAGTGRSIVSIMPSSGPGLFAYDEIGRFAFEPRASAQVPLPPSSALAALGLLLAGAATPRRQRGTPIDKGSLAEAAGPLRGAP